MGNLKLIVLEIKVELKKPDNSTQLIDNFLTTVDSSSRKYFEYDYTMLHDYGIGDMFFTINVDTEEKITEFFEDNNFYQIPFYVKEDTASNIITAEASVTFDGYDIIDGDFVANQPEILFRVDYDGELPADTFALRYTMDNTTISNSEFETKVDTANRTVTSLYKTPIIEDGDHYIRMTSLNESVNLSLDRFFTISNQLKIVDLYNYPNPFGELLHLLLN